MIRQSGTIYSRFVSRDNQNMTKTRRMKILYPQLASAVILLLLARAEISTAGQPLTYSDVAPVFQKNCIICHSGDGPPRGLRLDTYDNIRKGSDRGPVVAPGDPEKSELVRRIKGISQPRMPLTGPPYLDDETIARIEGWISDGAQNDTMPEKNIPVEDVPEEQIPGPGEPVSYSHVAPIFLKRCIKCHAEKGQMGGPPEGLILKTREQILAGGERVVVIPGNPAASLVVRHITGRERPRMPFDGPPYLSDEEIRLITDWIEQGAPDDEGKKAPVPTGARIRIEGTLTGYWEVDGAPLILAPGARVKKRPSPGDFVEVRGTVMPDGGIRVERIRRR